MFNNETKAEEDNHLFHVNDYSEFVQAATKILENNKLNKKYGILYLDILDFKLVNDFYGFQEGDRLLNCVAKFLNDLPHTKVCGRVFSDHFIRMFEYTDQDEIKAREMGYSKAVRKFLREQRSFHEKCTLKIAAGAAFIQDGPEGLIAAIDQANIARKNAKKSRKNSIVWCDEQMLEGIRIQKARETLVLQALENKAFTFYLQPKVDLFTGEIVGAEALARGIYGKGVTSPGEFIPVMEENGSIIKLDWLIMEQVFAYLSQEIAAGNPLVPVSINLSRAHINYDNVAQMIHEMASVYGVPPSLLEFELTETMLLDDFSAVRDIMDKMHAFGYKTSVDDFGAGYSGINIWQKLDFDVLKLDKQFVTEDPQMIARNQVIIPRLREISDDLDVVMLSEGIETIEQCKRMREAGCRLAQGFYFSQPVPVDQFRKLLKMGKFQIPVLEEETAAILEDNAIQRTWEHTVLKKKKHFGAISVILVLVFLSVFTIFYHYRNRLETEFNTLISENINSYTKTQSMEIESFQSSVVGTLEAICYLIESGEIDAQSRELNDYLSRIGQKERYLKVTYVTMDKISNILNNSESSEEDTKNFNLLMNGNTAISEVQYSSTFDGYYYSIAVPVRINGVTEGTVRGVISAERLIGTKQRSTQIEIIDSMVVKSDGTLVKISKSQRERAGSLEEELKKYHISDESVSQILNALHSDDDIQTFTLDGELNEQVFVSTAKLGYNDWHTVNFAVSSSIASHSSVILKETVQVGVMLIVLMLIAGIVVVCEMHRAERRSRYENEKYATLAQFSDTVLIQYDYRTDTISVTPNAAKHFKTEFLQKNHYIKEGIAILGIHEEDFASFRNIVQNPRRSEKVYTVNVRLTDKSEKYIWCSLQYRYLFEGNQPVAFIGKITDISHQIKREEQLRVQSCIDGLTHLLNKTASEQRIREKMITNRPGILMMMDIDNFKQINDRFGHASGDEALAAVGIILQETFREGDVIGRAGGDEFLIYMENTESAKAAACRAADVLKKLELYSVKHRVHISSSIGIAIYPVHGNNFEELFKTADYAMYQAKQLGKNRYYIAGEADRGESDRT